jgi:hypothetical protein
MKLLAGKSAGIGCGRPPTMISPAVSNAVCATKRFIFLMGQNWKEQPPSESLTGKKWR